MFKTNEKNRVSSNRPIMHLGMLSTKKVITMIDIILVRCISFLMMMMMLMIDENYDESCDSEVDNDHIIS